MIANPELSRNLWIECAPLRLAAALIAPVLILLLVADGRDWPADLFVASHYVMLIATAFWGARKAADAVAVELRERTWDQQRLSGLGPWSMTIGKLLGAPSAVWVVIGVCVAAQALSLAAGATWRSVDGPLLFGYEIGVLAIAIQIAGAFFVFAAAFFAGLLALNGQDRPRAYDATLFQLFGVATGVVVLVLISGVLTAQVAGRVELGKLMDDAVTDQAALMLEWWGIAAPVAAATALSYAALGGWAVYGAYHQMRRAFATPTTSIAWIGFLAFLAAFLAGWWPERWATIAAFGLAGATYAAALFEPHRLHLYRAWLHGLGGGRTGALIRGPAWIYAWIGAATLTGVALAQGQFQVFEQAVVTPPLALAGMLFILRDVGVCVWAGLRAPDGRGFWAAILILALLNIVLAPLLSLVLGDGGLALLAPVNMISVVSAAVQATVIWVLVAREVSAPVRGPSEEAG